MSGLEAGPEKKYLFRHTFKFTKNRTLQKVQNQTLRCGLFQTLEKQNQTLERGKSDT